MNVRKGLSWGTWVAVCGLWLTWWGTAVFGQGLEKVTEVEGITEYRLENGIPVLLFPDNTKPAFTVNMTVLVGSRHEGYGETGMAHLLEHMLFKGTERHRDIPALLKERGVLNMNGTTWYDRTNYYETLPASDENLEFAIRMEADRLQNSLIRGEDLASEMTVVRNEFEIGENSPFRILMQRISATAFEWHNYGKTTIGNRSDIERVPVENLRRFYEKYYQPDNVMVVVAGNFETEKALEYLQKYFGTLRTPDRELPKTYTEEPVQDGERLVTLRRAGDIQVAGVAYHVPAASDPDYPAWEVLSTILGIEPSGRLYKSLVETQLASSVSSMVMTGFDPGLLMCFTEVPKGNDLQKVQQILIEEIEKLGTSGVTDDEVKRAIQRLMKQREAQFADSESTAIDLSEWYASGDWRLYFLFRDRLEKVTAADVQRVAQKYLLASNRTVGLFIPTEKPVRAEQPKRADLATVLKDYRGREKIAAGESFEPTPENIQRATKIGQLPSGAKYAFLPKKTRGERVVVSGQIHFGSLESLKGQRLASELLGDILSRGTKNRDFTAFRDRLDELKMTLSLSSSPGSLNFSLQTKREFLPQALDLLREVLREPGFSAKELDVIRTEQIAQMEEMKSDPQGQAMMAIGRVMSAYPKEDPRYVPSIDESIEELKSIKIGDLEQIYKKQLGGEYVELAIVGDFEPAAIEPPLAKIFADWKSPVPYQRIPQPFQNVEGQRIVIETPDKANAVYAAIQPMEIRDDDPNYEALVIGNYILGGGPLSSRLADRVRKKEGLSYGVGSMFQAESQDKRGMLMMFALSNPTNTQKVVETIAEEVQLLLDSGVRDEELAKAKASFLESRRGSRADDNQLSSLLVSNLENGRSMDFQKTSDARLEVLSKEKVDQVLKSMVNPQKLIIVTAGDFSQGAQEKSGEGDK